MAEKKRNILDELLEDVQGLLDTLFNGRKKQLQRQPVPIPVRNRYPRPQQPRRNPYDIYR